MQSERTLHRALRSQPYLLSMEMVLLRSELTDDEKAACPSSYVKLAAGIAPPLRENISIYHMNGNGIKAKRKWMSTYANIVPRDRGMQEFASLGDLYGFVGKKIFGSFLEGPGKVMGLAPYGSIVHPPEAFFEFDHDDEITYKRTIPDLYTDDAPWPQDQERQANLAASLKMRLKVPSFASATTLVQCLQVTTCVMRAALLSTVWQMKK